MQQRTPTHDFALSACAGPTGGGTLSPPRLWGMPGITLLKLDKDGISLHFGSVFIPRAILQEPTFRAAVQSQGRSQFKSV